MNLCQTALALEHKESRDKRRQHRLLPEVVAAEPRARGAELPAAGQVVQAVWPASLPALVERGRSQRGLFRYLTEKLCMGGASIEALALG